MAKQGSAAIAARLDQALVEAQLVASRNRAQALVRGGRVRVDGVVTTRCGKRVPMGATLTVDDSVMPYVSRSGVKLDAALVRFGIVVDGTRCLDAGAGTGGFTDCLLQRGAAHVTAVDVGVDQLHPTLRTDPRVQVREGTDVRALSRSEVPPVDLLCADLSFISLRQVLPVLTSLLREGGDAVLLIKPQFESGPGRTDWRGVVRDPAVLQQAIAAVVTAVEGCSLVPLGLVPSPLPGRQGNREYLLWARKPPAPSPADLQALVTMALERPPAPQPPSS